MDHMDNGLNLSARNDCQSDHEKDPPHPNESPIMRLCL